MTPPTFLLLGTFLLGLLSASVGATPASRPNILFFFTDDQAFDTLGVYGNPDVKTPHIDSLGHRGVIFDRHYNTTSICMASRASMMTGLYEYKTGCNFTHGPTREEQWSRSYPLLLKKSGYRVGFGGKFGFHVGKGNFGKNQEGTRAREDFDFWVGGPGQTYFASKKNPSLAKYADQYPHSSRAYGAATIDFMRQSASTDAPFCMSVYYKAPHKPAKPDPMFDAVYRDTVFRKLPNYGREAGKHFSRHSQMGRQYPRFRTWGYAKEKSYQKELRLYHQQIHGIDASIGMILDELKKLNIAQNTVVIFSSDNGYFNGSHGLGSKVLPYEEGSRVPLIIYDPRNPHSGTMRRTTALSGGVDITATILDLAGVPIPESYDGRSLKPVLDNPRQSIRNYLPHFQLWGPEATRCMSIITATQKYIFWYYQDHARQLIPTEELYDLKKDPFEMKNILLDPAYKESLAALRGQYDLEIERWRNQGVKYHEYSEYEVLLDRKIGWPRKLAVLEKKGLGK